MNTNPMRMNRDFFTTDGLTLAKNLLGKILVHDTPYGAVRAVITETEAYMGTEDKGSHAYGGKRTERTEPMFHIGGTSYVYLIYGMYSCMNIAASVEDTPQAVLIRSVIPADQSSEEIMIKLRTEKQTRRRRTEDTPPQSAPVPVPSLLKHLADGPGKLCIALHITKADNNIDMLQSDTFYVTEGIPVPPETIRPGKRINIDYAEEAADYLWRFTITP